MPELLSCLVRIFLSFQLCKVQQLQGHHQCVASHSTVDPAALVLPICAVMSAGSKDLWKWFTLQSRPMQCGCWKSCNTTFTLASWRWGSLCQTRWDISLLYAVHQQYEILLYIYTCSEVGRVCMYSQQGQFIEHSMQGVGVGGGAVLTMHAVI